ncbi:MULTISPECIES: hypothetical protein [unclassified Microcoleus]|uniref:hypothetical protein n=1 Tax=unclassified Microcoleus TaxID=2642155 RepID=UPI002FD51A30
MNRKVLYLIVGLTLTASLYACSETPSSTNQAAPNASPDAMKSPDGMKSPDAMKSPGAMKSPDAMKSPGAMKSPDAMKK